MFEELVNKLSPIFRPIARDRKEADELAEQTLMVIEGYGKGAQRSESHSLRLAPLSTHD
jgi:hypothetical protein